MKTHTIPVAFFFQMACHSSAPLLIRHRGWLA